ncbi:hypothetical protein [Xanthomonas arboricola]|uniref:hypothetical protein n=1 Tax=Xanthomonas arboricola TaxID=56448 RepID=UPI00128FC430|nr:hypothetical protein [Xanthomonas arboricola]
MLTATRERHALFQALDRDPPIEVRPADVAVCGEDAAGSAWISTFIAGRFALSSSKVCISTAFQLAAAPCSHFIFWWWLGIRFRLDCTSLRSDDVLGAFAIRLELPDHSLSIDCWAQRQLVSIIDQPAWFRPGMHLFKPWFYVAETRLASGDR